jgi:hypothetical protein
MGPCAFVLTGGMHGVCKPCPLRCALPPAKVAAQCQQQLRCQPVGSELSRCHYDHLGRWFINKWIVMIHEAVESALAQA